MPTYTGEEKDQGPSPDEWEEYNRMRNQDQLLGTDSLISRERLEKYALICGK
jgi:hypothetical protein